MRHLPRLHAPRGALCTWIATAAVAATATLGFSAPAQAVVASVPTEGGTTVVGLQPRNDESIGTSAALASTFANPHGNPVVNSSSVYAIFWDPKGRYDGDWQETITDYLERFGTASGSFANVLTVDEQYTDEANESAGHNLTFRGAFPDTEPYPEHGNCVDPHPMALVDRITCLTDKQVRQQLEHFIGTHELKKGMSTVFYILTPPGVTVCLDAGGPSGHCSDSLGKGTESYENSFCSYHSDISPENPVSGNANTILYAMIPWTAGGLGDGDLAQADRTPAYDCQDGGFNPASTPEIEEPEHAKKKTEKEITEDEHLGPEEKKKLEEKEALEGPHEEEPNETTTTRSGDGWYDGGLADLIINQIAVEQQNTVTDPLLDAWQDEDHNESTDECRNFFATGAIGGSVSTSEFSGAGSLFNTTFGDGNYYLNTAFDLAALKLPYPGPSLRCLGGINQRPEFTAPNPVNAGDLVGFDGMESYITLNAGTRFLPDGEEEVAYPLFTWNFGDGTPTVTGYAPGGPTLNSPSAFTCNSPWAEPCAAGTFHSYQYGGTYKVTLTATDVGGNTVSVTHEITVDGPEPPKPPAPPAPPASSSGSSGSGSGSSSSTAGGTSGSGGSHGGATVPGPVAEAAASNNSLPQALRRGLLVNYSVNEQVAGHFEVLLNAQVARGLGVKGQVAAGLPAGTPASLVIGQAILVTTKGGHSTVRIKFSKQTAKRLHRVHSVSLMLRLVVHNAASQNPQSATVLTTFVLHR